MLVIDLFLVGMYFLGGTDDRDLPSRRWELRVDNGVDVVTMDTLTRTHTQAPNFSMTVVGSVRAKVAQKKNGAFAVTVAEVGGRGIGAAVGGKEALAAPPQPNSMAPRHPTSGCATGFPTS